jgi:mRNA interferase MazF
VASGGGSDWVLAQITSNPYGDPAAVSLASGSFAQGGLPRQSFVRPGKFFTASDSIVVRQVGELTAAALRSVVEAIVKLLGAALP